MTDLRLAPLGYQQITSLSSAKSLTVPDGANAALIVAEVASIRWRDDGTAPTASVGMLVTDTDAPFLYTGALSAFQAIAVSGSPVLNISYYRIAG